MIAENFFQKIIMGDAKIISTMGILTAENPHGRKYVKETNERKNNELLEYLKKKGYDPIQINGRFAGMNEHPWLILNIERQELADLGKKYGQESVIFAKRKGKIFEFSYIQGERTIRKGKLKLEHPEKKNDDVHCYFSLGGQKFTIRF